MFARAGKAAVCFLAGYLTCVLGFHWVSEAGAAGGAPSLQNGDVNGDQVLNLTDAIYLLNYLFQSGAPITPIECEGGPPPAKARIRFGIAVLCGEDGVSGTLNFCGTRVSTTSVPDQFTPTACMEAPVEGSCPVRITIPDGGCGALEFCTTVSAAEGDVFDFVLFLDNEPLVGFFKQKVDAQGQCPPFPSPGTTFTEVIQSGCPAGGAGALNAGGGWRRLD